MSDARQWLLTVSNIVLASAVTFYVFGRGPKSEEKTSEPSPASAVDLEPLLEPISSLEDSLGRFAGTLQRFNTTLVQYDFLQKDIERIGNLDQAVANRLNQEIYNQSQLGADATEETKKSLEQTITQIKEFQGQVQKELEQRRQMLMQLIAGLEQELATSSLDENKVREIIGDTPMPAQPPSQTVPTTPTPTPTPAPAPAPAPTPTPAPAPEPAPTEQ
jgi:hypothetical protein